MTTQRTARRILGTLINDCPRFVQCLLSPSGWVAMRNRQDVVKKATTGFGIQCEWEHTRQLHLCNMFPITGRWILRRALRQWPVRFRETPASTRKEDSPDVSFLIGHRGVDRLPHLLLTLESIAGQEGAQFECIVVEQDIEPLIRDRLPSWVRYVHTPLPEPNMPYCRSWAFNVAAREARGAVLVLHDNDMLVPARYGSEVHSLIPAQYEIAQLKRFVFYMDECSTRSMFECKGTTRRAACEQVIENLEGGGSVAVSRDAYFAMGGMDEEFIGWGGEDAEFWDRCRTRRLWPYGFLPLVHLWHPAQPGKRAVRGLGATTAQLTEQRRSMSPSDRIDDLASRPWGQRELKIGT